MPVSMREVVSGVREEIQWSQVHWEGVPKRVVTSGEGRGVEVDVPAMAQSREERGRVPSKFFSVWLQGRGKIPLDLMGRVEG